MTAWLIDVGNTTLKLQHVEDDVAAPPLIIARKSFQMDEQLAMQQLLQAAARFPTARTAHACCARAEDVDLVKRLLQQLAPGVVPQFLSAMSKLPFAIKYECGMPGPDRIAAALALRALAPGVAAASIDFGTATNIVLVDANGDFVGGSIMPGIALAASSLHEATNGVLPLVQFAKDSTTPPAIGSSPEGAIRAGILYGHAGGVERLLVEMERELGVPIELRIATGGNAAQVMPLLRMPHRHEPHLTLMGLRQLL